MGAANFGLGPIIAFQTINTLNKSGGGLGLPPKNKNNNIAMKIKGKLGEYIVKWGSFGYTGAEALVYKPVEIKSKGFKLFGFQIIPEKIKVYNKLVWSEGPGIILISDAEKMHPKEMKVWFTRVVEQYENYKIAWEQENS